MKIAIIAMGSWGTAIAKLLAENGHDVWAYARDEELIATLRATNQNERYLPGVRLPESIRYTHSVEEALDGAELVVNAVPTQSFRSSLASYVAVLRDGMILVNLSKGIEISTGKTISEVAKEILDGAGKQVVVCTLSGPTHAEEVGVGMPSAIVVASEDMESAKRVQEAFTNENFRVYTSNDLRGVEICGALKNIIALASGVADGLGFGDNTKAALITRGISEIARFGLARGADRQTFSGLAGVGDMIVTCTSRHSRNRKCGELIGKGATLAEATKEVGMVVEGAHTCKAVMEMRKDIPEIEMPITEVLYKILYEDYPARKALKELMERKLRHEHE